MELRFHVICFNFLVMGLNTILLYLFCLVYLLIVVFHHSSVSLGVYWWLSHWLLTSPLLNFYDCFAFFIFADILSDCFIFLQFFSSPPQCSSYIKNLYKAILTSKLSVSKIYKSTFSSSIRRVGSHSGKSIYPGYTSITAYLIT